MSAGPKGLVVVALCLGNELFEANRILDRKFAKRYPGTSWIPELGERLSKVGVRLVTADVALGLVKNGAVRGHQVGLLQHDVLGAQGEQLLGLGSVPLVAMCYESPLYSPEFYRQITKLDSIFPARVIFGGVADSNTRTRVFPAYFPCFEKSDLDSVRTQHVQPKAVFVVANKFVGGERKTFFQQILSFFQKIFTLRMTSRRVGKTLGHWVRSRSSKVLGEAIDSGTTHTLQDSRLEIIAEGLGRSSLDLFGGGWDEVDNIPEPWRSKLLPFLRVSPPRRISDKLSTISRYRFCFAIENYSYSGYVTEKIFEPLVAGIVPVYLGAPDIVDWVPKQAFVDIRDYPNPEALFTYLETMSLSEYNEIRLAGQAFIRGTQGFRYSHEAVAEFYETLILELGSKEAKP